jgi:adenine specific DNA methylase Mod
MRPRCVELARVLKKTGSFYYHCDWHASHYVKVMLDQIFKKIIFNAKSSGIGRWQRTGLQWISEQSRHAFLLRRRW